MYPKNNSSTSYVWFYTIPVSICKSLSVNIDQVLLFRCDVNLSTRKRSCLVILYITITITDQLYISLPIASTSILIKTNKKRDTNKFLAGIKEFISSNVVIKRERSRFFWISERDAWAFFVVQFERPVRAVFKTTVNESLLNYTYSPVQNAVR